MLTLRAGFTALVALPFSALAAPTIPQNSTRVGILAVDPPTALPQRATADDLRWQPVLDFDKDGCYNVPAIDADGNVAEGLNNNWVGLASDCRDQSDLENNNVYSRQRCNNGWCAYIYDYYFEKDVAIPYFQDPGHRHDWEHIAVWVKDDRVEYVGVSQHGEYEIKAASDIADYGWDGERVKVIYHKDGVGTHCFRFANDNDEPPENHFEEWFLGDLVSWNGFPDGIRDILSEADFGQANFALKESSFSGNLESSMPDDVDFDIDLDEGSPGDP